MKDIREVLSQKEQEIERLQREIEILRAASAILEGSEFASTANRGAVPVARPSNVEPITHADAASDRPRRAFP
jgi:hypothetical protein